MTQHDPLGSNMRNRIHGIGRLVYEQAEIACPRYELFVARDDPPPQFINGHLWMVDDAIIPVPGFIPLRLVLNDGWTSIAMTLQDPVFEKGYVRYTVYPAGRIGYYRNLRTN